MTDSDVERAVEPDVVVLDLGMGNLRSVVRAIERARARPIVTSDPQFVARAARLVVPGQGHFADCARAMQGPLGAACRAHIGAARPYLGICLGMQILFESSEEAPGAAGLGILAGRVVRFEPGREVAPGERRRVPHVGWNLVRGAAPALPEPDWFYFVHGYHCVPNSSDVVAGWTDYGEPVCAALVRGPLWACQFHPEKSGAAGLAFLRRFLSIEAGGKA